MSQENSQMSDDLMYILGTTYHVEGDYDWEEVRDYLNHTDFPNRNEDFKNKLAEAIFNHTISPREYVKLTDDASVTKPEDVEGELRLLWQYIYGDEPINKL